MKTKLKPHISILLLFVLALSLTGCGSKKEKNYQNYIKSLISINYLGATDEYLKATNSNKEDAVALYNANIDILSDRILKYYGLSLSNDSEIKEEYNKLAKNIYSRVNFSVSNAYEVNAVYKLDVEIHPMNIFNQAEDAIREHIDTFNKKVNAGEFNDYTVDAYNDAFSSGILDILNSCCEDMQYTDPVTITVVIIEKDKSYYISDEDFLAIDAAMIATSETVSSTTDAEGE